MVNFNGEISAIDQAPVSVHNRGLNYGDAVFETVKYSAGKLFFWEDHYFRLMASMRIMRMSIPMSFTMEFLEEEILKLIQPNEKTKAFRIKFLVCRAEGGTYTPTTKGVNYIITKQELSNPFYLLNETPYEVELFKDHYLASGLLSTFSSSSAGRAARHALAPCTAAA